MKYKILKESILKEMSEEDDFVPGDGLLHVFDYGEDCPFAERFVVILPTGDTYRCSADAHLPNGVGYYDGTTDYTTRQEMEDNLECDGITPVEVDDPSTLPDGLQRFIKRAMEESND